MDVGTKNGWQHKTVMNFQDILHHIQSKWPLEALEANYRGEVASRYKYIGHKGEIGFISSISKPFCRDCSRARLSADGKLYTCLFANESFDLKSFLRNDNKDSLKEYIKNVWQNRDDRYSEIRNENTVDKENRIEMYVIGG